MRKIIPCKYCRKNGEFSCGKQKVDSPYLCTREKGHKGIHVACGTDSHKIAEWPDEESTRILPDNIEDVVIGTKVQFFKNKNNSNICERKTCSLVELEIKGVISGINRVAQHSLTVDISVGSGYKADIAKADLYYYRCCKCMLIGWDT